MTPDIFDLSGKRIISFKEGPKKPDSYAVQWNGLGGGGQKATTGLYFYRLTAGKGLVSGFIHCVQL